MKTWTTLITAISPVHGDLRSYVGPRVPGLTAEHAQQYCEENGLGYCKVDGQLISEIPCKKGTYEPDWDKEVFFPGSHEEN
jgi:hypothetical protein